MKNIYKNINLEEYLDKIEQTDNKLIQKYWIHGNILIIQIKKFF